MRLIDADKMVHYQTYDDEHEEFREHTSTIADFLDTMTDEGCPYSEYDEYFHELWCIKKHKEVDEDDTCDE